MRVAAYGPGEPARPFGGALGDGLPGPGERGGGLGEGQGRGVLRVQPSFGGRGGVPPQAGSREGVLRVVEGGGERDAAGDGVPGADGVEEVRDGVVHTGDGVPLSVEPEVPDERAGGGQGQSEPEQPGGTGEIAERPLPPALRQRHPGSDGGGDEELRTGGGGDGPDGTDAAGEESEAGEKDGERDGAEAVTCVRTDQQPGGPGQRRHP